eukprot:c4626_g1_i1.p1 GENE.c4626_g1_i1~~c4626_g1_i1.p1  ORF type:complete len:439 (+),score=95.26 c4626_g1_i1:74-1390(+)
MTDFGASPIVCTNKCPKSFIELSFDEIFISSPCNPPQLADVAQVEEFELDSNPVPPDPIPSIQIEEPVPAPRKACLEDFDLLCTVGVGAFGKVLQVAHKVTKEIYALKIMRKDTILSKKAERFIKSESAVMRDNQHPFIIGLLCSFQTNGKLYLVMDFANGGPLWSLLKKEAMLSEATVRFYVAEIALALEHLHAREIVHRDLKPENILVDYDGHVRITDFGLAKDHVSGIEGARSFCGTDDYIAPEIIKGGPYGQAVDWWSLGALTFDMLTGSPPFVANNPKQLYQKICNEKVRYPSYLTASAVSFLKGLLNRDPVKRYESGIAFRKHAFFKGVNWNNMINMTVSPPFRPHLTDRALDVSNFSPQYTRMPPRDSPMERVLNDNNVFAGFSHGPSPSFFGVCRDPPQGGATSSATSSVSDEEEEASVCTAEGLSEEEM